MAIPTPGHKKSQTNTGFLSPHRAAIIGVEGCKQKLNPPNCLHHHFAHEEPHNLQLFFRIQDQPRNRCDNEWHHTYG